MKLNLLNLGIITPIIASGVFFENLSAQAAIILGSGDRLDVAGQFQVTNSGTLFNFLIPAGAVDGSNVIVTGATGGFSPFALPGNANGQGGGYQVIPTLSINPLGPDLSPTGSALPANPLNLLTVAANNPSCVPGPCQALAPLATPFDFITLEAASNPSVNNPDVKIQLTEINFLSAFPLGPGNTQTALSGLFDYVDDEGTKMGTGSFNATFVNNSNTTSWSGTFSLDEVPRQVPEPSSIVALATVVGVGAFSLKKRIKH